MYKVVLVLTSALLAGCASPAAIDKMTVKPATHSSLPNAQLKENVTIQSVSGGKSTNPLWVSKVGNDGFKQALEESLRNAMLLSNSGQSSKYTLDAKLLSLDQPVAGLDMTVTAAVEYTLTERATQKVLYSKIISTPYTATFSDSAIGFIRIKIANEGAIHENIRSVIEALNQLKLSSDNISMIAY